MAAPRHLARKPSLFAKARRRLLIELLLSDATYRPSGFNVEAVAEYEAATVLIRERRQGPAEWPDDIALPTAPRTRELTP